jgi:hypothetical protein
LKKKGGNVSGIPDRKEVSFVVGVLTETLFGEKEG